MDSSTRTAGKPPRPVARLTNGESMADRARALVDRTRAGLGAKGVMVKRSAGLGVEGLGVLPDNLPVYDFDFIKELEQIRAEHISQAHNLTVAFKQRELTIVMDGVSRLLESVGVMDPNMVSKVAQCQKLLNEILSGTSFEDDSSQGSDDEGGDYYDNMDENEFKRDSEFQSNAKGVKRYDTPNDRLDLVKVKAARKAMRGIYTRDRTPATPPGQQ